jgi:hypothetical protein
MTKKVIPPYFDAPWEVADASAFQALQRGDASPEQQKRSLDWLIRIGAATYNATFFPGQQDASAFAEGRRFVGLEVVKLLSVNPQAFIKDKAQ